MESITSNVCCGCLSTDRKTKSVNELNKNDTTYHDIMNEITLQIDVISLNLCWECDSRILNFIKFKDQMRMCMKLLQDYVKEPHSDILRSISNLIITPPKIHDHKDSQTDDDENNKNNTRTSTKANVKHEKPSSDNDDDDDITLTSLKDIMGDDNDEINVVKKEDKTHVKKGKKIKVMKEKKSMMFEEFEQTLEEILKERISLEYKAEYVNSLYKCEKCIITFANELDLKDHEHKKHLMHSQHVCDICACSFRCALSLSRHYRRHSTRFRCLVCGHCSVNANSALAHYKHTHAKVTISELNEMAAKAYGKHTEKNQGKRKILKSKVQLPCQYCDKTFAWKTSLRKHLETHIIELGHKRKPLCESCNLTFTSTFSLQKHIQCSSKHQINIKLRKLKEAPNSHPNSTEQITDIESIKIEVMSEKRKFPCPQCGDKFQWKGNLWRHLQTHAASANGGYSCEPCNRKFSSIATYKQHMAKSKKHVTEEDFKYMCSDCGKRFCKKPDLKDHIDWEHLKKYTHICAVCQKVFKSASALYLHKTVVHKLNNSSHLCDHCGKAFPTKSKLATHITSLHNKSTPYKCPTCGAKFNWHSCLSRHIKKVHKSKISAVPVEYMCSDCGKRFCKKPDLKDHIDWEHLKKYTHICAVCQKVFKSASALYLHKTVVHKLNNSSHLCDHCGKAFPTKSKLATHITSLHNKSTPYKCPTCGAKFNWHSCLSRHIKKVHKSKISAVPVE